MRTKLHLLTASLLRYRCSSLKHHRLSSAFDLNRCLSLLAAHSVLGLWKTLFGQWKPKFGLARGSLLARHLINEVPRCGARKVGLQATLPGKAPRFARRTARHSVASLLRSSLSAFGLTVALQAKLPEKDKRSVAYGEVA